MMTPTERWHQYAKGGDPADCWEWSGPVNYTRYGTPYGRFRVSGRTTPAHRLSYELFRGAIPEGLTIDHLCRNTLCVNPWHLEVVTRAENTRRRPSDHCGRLMAAKTHCPYGHPYDADNTYIRLHGQGRSCRKCMRDKQRRYYHERKAASA